MMSQRASGYARKERDDYQTPTWVTELLLPHLGPRPLRIWEPAAGRGQMVAVLSNAGHKVFATDIASGVDFLAAAGLDIQAVVTNPPYSFASEFIVRSLQVTRRHSGMVAMLLRTDFDHAQGRQNLFGKCWQFSRKVVLLRRITWFEPATASPSFNHAWFIWNWQHTGKPTLHYEG